MSEFYIGTSWRKDGTAEMVSVERLSLAGCVGVWNNRLRSFPHPLIALDHTLSITRYDKVTRFRGLLPSETSDDYLVKGHPNGEIDIPTGLEHGEGSVYLGNGNTPSETWGYIFERMVPFDPALELAFVRDPTEQEVLHTIEYPDVVGHLVYGDPQVLESLGRIIAIK
ncbi:MAG TPA: hypothetical protein PKD20_05105 [Candidatus Saccharibacteria bacterium]|nr:hypothetical protein [Candidatus Saccharibacteria bacterium]